MDRKVIKRKIEKLLALSESTNESEAMSAARTARKLMLKYHISMTEREKAGMESPLGSSRISIKELRFKRTPMRRHHLILAFILAKNFRCKTYYQYGETPCVKFIGFGEDAFAALALLNYLIRFMEQGVGKYAGQKHQEHSFRDGFCIGVLETFEAQNKEEPGYGLMLETPVEVMEAYKKLNLKKEPAVKGRTPYFLDEDAFSCGENYGRQAMDRRSIPFRE